LHDPVRNLETARVEGLTNADACASVLATGAALPGVSGKTSTQWHPDWRLEIRRAEPMKLTTWVYNGQPDPFSGGAIASCAPPQAQLPDGKPIAVLCKQVEQATSDGSGALGFGAALQSGVPARQRSWTYNALGRLLTAKGPRTDVDDTTAYSYYATSSSDYTVGDLQQLANPLGQVTTYPKYNRSGQVLRTVDANGIVTDATYDLRQRPTAITTGGQQTLYAYDLVGQLVGVTLPDTTRITYTWDDSHRLTRISDQAGNSITYTLDYSDNRIAEEVRDARGSFASRLTRAFDALGRLQQVTGAPQ
jgi:YD repeat-containing protein